MKQRWCFFSILKNLTPFMLALFLAGCGQYNALRNDWEIAAPPALLDQVSSPVLSTKPTSAVTEQHNAAVSEHERLRGLAVGMLGALDDNGPADFFHPDPERLRRLQPAAGDETAAFKALADGFTLADLRVLTLLRTPALREAEAAFRATLMRYEQTMALDDLLERYASFTQGLEPGVGAMTGRTPLAALYPFPGVIALRGDIAHHDALVAVELLQAARRTVLTAAAKGFWELHYAHKAHGLAEQSKVMIASLKDTMAARYAVGQVDMVQLVRVNQEYSRVQEQVPIQLEMRRAREAPVRALLGLSAEEPIGIPAEAGQDNVVPDLDKLLALAFERRQELRELRAELKRAELLIELAETGIYPGFSFNLSLPERNEVLQVGSEGERADSFATTTKASLGAGRPISANYGIESAYLNEARQNLLGLRAQLSAAEADTRRLVHEAWFRFDKAGRDEAVSRDKVVPLAVTDLDTIAAGYSAGKLFFADLVEATSRWFEARQTWERQRADLGIARAELEEAVGVALGQE